VSTEHSDAPQRGWVNPGVVACPACQAVVLVRDDGTLFGHYRYTASTYLGRTSDRIRCEGERT